ncbi:hypothetical protein [Pseudodonghicola flavimaris]|uniref:SGNH/GDSL hydrolase family protein n=1 Tax=Pseudodonghicola flavimaris TaxID=3050036 RepID=A0ABT7EZ72_9RHOB|nr:hypothetical protein [Pseudodonghicola flavimaris]MDK3017635.1 hypothetical protein [Pseudodonghicola flavimaris]
MRGLIFGNSHVGALYSCWAQAKQIDADFYAIPGGGGPNVTLEGDRIFPSRENADVQSTIRGVQEDGLSLTDYDYVAFCSMGLAAVREEYPGHILNRFLLAEYTTLESKGSSPVSRAVLAKCMQRAHEHYPAMATLRKIRTLFDGPILATPVPIPVVSLLKDDHPLRYSYGMNIIKFTSWIASFQLEMIRSASENIDIEVLDYPNMDWVNAGSTPEEYATRDAWHMNRAYGELLLNQIHGALS